MPEQDDKDRREDIDIKESEEPDKQSEEKLGFECYSDEENEDCKDKEKKKTCKESPKSGLQTKTDKDEGLDGGVKSVSSSGEGQEKEMVKEKVVEKKSTKETPCLKRRSY